MAMVFGFEATPPGHDPIKITPAATAGSKPNTIAKEKPSSGMTVNCRKIPMSIARGIVRILVKSETARVAPIPNMINWMSGTISVFSSKSP